MRCKSSTSEFGGVAQCCTGMGHTELGAVVMNYRNKCTGRFSLSSVLCCLALTTTVCLFPARQVEARTVIGHGLRLTVSLGGLTHPRDSLIRVGISVRNVSHHTITLCGDCVSGAIEADVMDRFGRIDYPPAVPELVTNTGGRRRSSLGRKLAAGAVLREDQFIILRARYVRAVVTLANTRSTVVTSSPVTFVNQPGPQLSLVLTPVVSVTLHDVAAHYGPIYYSYSYRCAETDGTEASGYDWQMSDSTTITPEIDPSCGRLLEFHLVAGALNQPVGRVDYKA